MLHKSKNILIVLVYIFIFLPSVVFAQTTIGSADATAISTTTWILDDFDNHELSTNVNVYNGGKHKVEWNIVASQFITRTDAKPYPQKAFVSGVPVILPTEYKREEAAMRVFAIRAAFNTKGINTLELFPTDANAIIKDTDGKPMQGIFFFEPVYQIGLYALGILRDFKIYAVFESVEGEAFAVSLGNLNYKGWKVLTGKIPIEKYINEQSYINDRYAIRLEKIVIETSPRESVSDFVIYFDEIFYTLSSVNDRYYDGYDLSRPDFKYNYINKQDGKENITWESAPLKTQ